jgi:octaprenyl-diphosphate synthase
MGMRIEEVWSIYRRDLELAEEKIRETLQTVAPAIKLVGEHIFSGGGKRIRPLLGIISSRLSGYHGEKASILACCVESIHTASLLHDDIVDGANIRRGRPAAHSIWGEQVVVLVGDYLYSNALRLINLLGSQKIMDAFSTATAKMSEGELLQLQKKEQSKKGILDISEVDYINIVTGKTAILMSAACRGGAVLGNVPVEKEEALTQFGLKLGIAFQITDDILDYMAEEGTFGKGLGKDLQEGKITLPLIYLLKDVSNGEVKRVKEIIRKNTFSASDLSTILELLKKYMSIEKSYEYARMMISEAKETLKIFDDSNEKAALLTISDYILERKK